MEVADESLNHPKGISFLFFTEMWERMSFYGMRAILIFYLVQELGMSDADAGEIYALYTSLVYLTPIIGGYLADQFLGYKRSVYLGSFLILLGHVSLAIPGGFYFYLGLTLLILGTGFFKPNLTTVFGKLYDSKPKIRDSGYTIFYIGINFGGLFGPIICGTLGELVSWHLGFFSAAIGMAIGILIFYFGSKSLPDELWEIKPKKEFLNHSNIPSDKTNETSLLGRLALILLLSFFSIFFWMSFEQMGSSLNLFALRQTDRFIFGYEIPAAVLQSLNPMFILLFGPLLSSFWTKLAKKQLDPNPVVKFIYSLFFLGLGFLVMVFAAKIAETGVLVSVFFLFFLYFWNTVSELCLSPVGLSFVSRVAPVKFTSMLMGIWFLSTAFGHYLAGILSGFQTKLGSMANFYSIFVITSWGAGVVLFLIYIWKRKQIRKIA
ncbi:peptide MFS transporter [Leptospira sp. 96542]|nr:peptide MFS transporter [Leptospira sp. 96542]